MKPSDVAVLLGGPCDLTRLTVQGYQSEIRMPLMYARSQQWHSGRDAEPIQQIQFAVYKRTLRCTMSPTLIYEWVPS